MRVAMVHCDLPPGGSGGGVRHQVAGLSEALTARDHDVVVHVLAPPPPASKYQVRRLRGGHWSEASRLRQLAVAPLSFATARYAPADVIHAHGDSHLMVRRSTPVVRTFYGSARDEGRVIDDWKRRALARYNHVGERVARRLADRTVGISSATQHSVGPLDAIIPCGIDRDRFQPGEKYERPTVLFIGRMAGRKRGALVEHAFRSHVLPRVPDAELVLVAADARGSDSVRAVPSTTNDELAELLRRAWVFTMPSIYEGFGVPYVEAMASGTAVVTTPNAGALEIFGGANAGGELVSENDLGLAIAAVLLDDRRREELAVEGRDASMRYDWPEVAASYERIYEDVAIR